MNPKWDKLQFIATTIHLFFDYEETVLSCQVKETKLATAGKWWL